MVPMADAVVGGRGTHQQAARSRTAAARAPARRRQALVRLRPAPGRGCYGNPPGVVPSPPEEPQLPRRDAYHDAVKNALLKDGWTITHDPLTLPFGSHKLFVDLGAERLLAAERGNERIAVEVKTFVGPSEVTDMEQALGQYLLYRSVLSRSDPDRRLILAMPEEAFDAIITAELGQAIREDYALSILAFDIEEEIIRKWLR
jgi:hypothetical protein